MILDLLDLRGALGDRAGLANVDPMPSFGLYATLILALSITGLGAGFVVERGYSPISSH